MNEKNKLKQNQTNNTSINTKPLKREQSDSKLLHSIEKAETKGPKRKTLTPARRKKLIKKIIYKKHKSSNMRKFDEVITDPLCFAIACNYRGYLEPVSSEWPSIKSDLMQIVMTFKHTNTTSPVPSYDTKEIHRGFKIIKCMDEFSKEFLFSCFKKIGEDWKELNLKLIPAEKVPKSIKSKSRIQEDDPPNFVRPYSEVITDPLCLAVAGEREGYDVPIRYQWPYIELEFMEHVKAYNLTNKNGPTLFYDTSEVHRGFRIIKCMNEFSKEFVNRCFNQICEKWKKINLKLIPACNLPQRQRKPIELKNEEKLRKARNNPNYSETFVNNPQPSSPSTPPAPCWSGMFESNINLESPSDNHRNSEYFGQLNARENTNKRERAVIQSTRSRKTSTTTSSQNNASYMNPFTEYIGFQLDEKYDLTNEKESFVRNSDFQQEYPQTSWQSSYKSRTFSNYLNTGRETKSTESPETDKNQTFLEGWQKLSDYYGDSRSSLREAYQHHQQDFGDTNTNSAFLFNTFTEEGNYNKYSQVASNFRTDDRPKYEDDILSTNFSQNFKAFSTPTREYSFRHESRNFLSSDNDELPPPPPSFKSFDDYENDWDSFRSRRGRRISRSRSIDRRRRISRSRGRRISRSRSRSVDRRRRISRSRSISRSRRISGSRRGSRNRGRRISGNRSRNRRNHWG